MPSERMTAQELAAAIGRVVLLPIEDGKMEIPCLVLDAKWEWGKGRFLIQPFGGTGTAWKELTSLKPYRVSAEVVANNGISHAKQLAASAALRRA